MLTQSIGTNYITSGLRSLMEYYRHQNDLRTKVEVLMDACSAIGLPGNALRLIFTEHELEGMDVTPGAQALLCQVCGTAAAEKLIKTRGREILVCADCANRRGGAR